MAGEKILKRDLTLILSDIISIYAGRVPLFSFKELVKVKFAGKAKGFGYLPDRQVTLLNEHFPGFPEFIFLDQLFCRHAGGFLNNARNLFAAEKHIIGDIRDGNGQ